MLTKSAEILIEKSLTTPRADRKEKIKIKKRSPRTSDKRAVHEAKVAKEARENATKECLEDPAGEYLEVGDEWTIIAPVQQERPEQESDKNSSTKFGSLRRIIRRKNTEKASTSNK